MEKCSVCGKELRQGEQCNCRSIDPVPAVQQNVQRSRVLLLCCLAVLLLVACLILAGLNSGYQKPIRKLVRGLNAADAGEMLEACHPSDMLARQRAEMEERGGIWSDYLAESDRSLQQMRDDWAAAYGANPQLSVAIYDEQPATADEISTVSRYYGESDQAIEKIYVVKVRFAVSGGNQTEENRGFLYVVKFKGDGWKVCAKSLMAFPLFEAM